VFSNANPGSTRPARNDILLSQQILMRCINHPYQDETWENRTHSISKGLVMQLVAPHRFPWSANGESVAIGVVPNSYRHFDNRTHPAISSCEFITILLVRAEQACVLLVSNHPKVFARYASSCVSWNVACLQFTRVVAKLLPLTSISASLTESHGTGLFSNV